MAIMMLAVLLACIFVTSSGLELKEEIEFIEHTFSWKRLARKGQNYPIDDCLFFNFGYEKELTYSCHICSDQHH